MCDKLHKLKQLVADPAYWKGVAAFEVFLLNNQFLSHLF
jgi:hypothetical protein